MGLLPCWGGLVREQRQKNEEEKEEKSKASYYLSIKYYAEIVFIDQWRNMWTINLVLFFERCSSCLLVNCLCYEITIKVFSRNELFTYEHCNFKQKSTRKYQKDLTLIINNIKKKTHKIKISTEFFPEKIHSHCQDFQYYFCWHLISKLIY